MAKPPEPIEEVLPAAVLVIDGEVEAVLSTGPTPPKVNAEPGTTSTGQTNASQQVKLKVKRILHGKQTAEVVATKPESGYMLRAGNHGPFLLDASNTILGRYGPDSWSFQRIEAALKKN